MSYCIMQTNSRMVARCKVHTPRISYRSGSRRVVQQPVCLVLNQGCPAAAARHLCTKPCNSVLNRQLLPVNPCCNAAAISRRRCRRTAALPPLAMINVDFASPSLVLGIALIGCGVALLQVRNMQREVSRDADIVVAAMISIVGSTLIFQGWRLDPLLLLCQALTTSVAFWYGLEAFKLRQQVVEEDDGIAGQLPPPEGYNQMNEPYSSANRSGFLPPADSQMPPWGTQQQQQQQPQQPGYSSRWGLPSADQSMQQYGSYLGQQQQQQMPEGAYAEYEGQYAAGSSGQGLPPLQQQQFAAPGDYASSSGYSSSVYGQPQQQQQYGAGGYGVQEGWYGTGAVQPLYGQQYPPGIEAGAAVSPMGADGAAAAAGAVSQYGLGLMQDGAAGDAGYVAEGSALLPLPPGGQPQQQQQQQQQQFRSNGSIAGQTAYERVDDWE